MDASLPGIQKHSPPIKVAIFSSYRAVVPHFETELDIAQQHLDRGDSVTFVSCLGGLANCEFNIEKDGGICENCRGRRKMGLELLSQPVRQIEFSQIDDLPEDLQLEFESVEELIKYQWNEFDIGYAALSSLVSFCRDPDPDLNEYRDHLRMFLISSWQSFQQSKSILSQNSFDRVYVYNGRFAGMRSTLRACQQLNLDCYLHERGCDGQHFELLKNHLPHDLEKIELAIRDAWSQADPVERQVIGKSWFDERIERVEKVWHSFTKRQQRERLPDNWDPSRKNVSIFCSSDDEFVAIGDAWKNDLYPNQVDAIESIVRDMGVRQPETRFYLRMHPNLTNVDNSRCRKMKSMDFENLTVIHPESEIDTYQLIRKSDIVVSFGSSVGAEAVYWGTPSVLLGPCFYQNLGGVYRSHSHAQTLDWLADELEPKDNQGMLMYGHWFQTRGYPHRYFESTGLFNGHFKGQTVYAKPVTKPKGLKRLVHFLKRFVSN